jgi:DNA-binding response OmpR family regulator
MSDRPAVLVVDDIPDNLRALGSLLENAGYEVRLAANGPDALTSAAAAPPDLILLDVLMPGMDGYELCRRLRALPLQPAAPVIFISALDRVEDKVAAFREGGVDYIAKPFQADEVLARIRTHLQLAKTEELKRSLAERDALLREVHHRVKNNLAVITSLLRLQSAAVTDAAQARAAFAASVGRIEAMAMVHEAVYAAGDLARVDMNVYAERLAAIRRSDGACDIRLAGSGVAMELNAAMSCGLLLYEMLSAACRLAEERGGATVSVDLNRRPDGVVALDCAVAAMPAPAGSASGDELSEAIIAGLAGQLGGGVESSWSPAGFSWRVRLRPASA